MNSHADFSEALGVDVGSKRIGVARVNAVAKIPQPLMTVTMNDEAAEKISQLAKQYDASLVVVGVPLTTSGVDSDQTQFSRRFADTLKDVGLTVVEHDETLSTVEAQTLIDSGVYARNSIGEQPGIDEVAACVILDNFIKTAI